MAAAVVCLQQFLHVRAGIYVRMSVYAAGVRNQLARAAGASSGFGNIYTTNQWLAQNLLQDFDAQWIFCIYNTTCDKTQHASW
jgi:hypothetical protein